MRVTKMVFHISKPSDDEMKSACERALPMLEPVFWKSLECLKRRVGGYSVFIYSFSQQNHHKWGVYIRKAFGVELDADEYTAQLGEHRALKRTGAPVVFTVPLPPPHPSRPADAPLAGGEHGAHDPRQEAQGGGAQGGPDALQDRAAGDDARLHARGARGHGDGADDADQVAQEAAARPRTRQPSARPAPGRPDTLHHPPQPAARTARPDALHHPPQAARALPGGGFACVLPQIQPFRAQESSETLQAYVTARTKHFRARPPLILALTESHFPAIIRNPKFAIQLDGPHKAAVAEIREWFHRSGWRGLRALFPHANAECTRYGVPRQPDQQSSAIELHRRALCLEEACSRLLSFVLRTAESSPTLRQLAQKDLQAALDCISAGSGVFGAGECFWMPPPATHPALTRLAQAVTTPKADPHLRSTIDWLTAHRQEAFTRTYVAADELSWGLPLLGLVATLPLGRLHEPGAAEEARRALLEDHRDRLHVYQEDLKRLVVYGANLTHYVERVHALASAFRPLGQAFPEHCRPAELDSEGRMVGADAKPCPLGHVQFALTGRRAPPLPFPMDCLNVKPGPPSWPPATRGGRPSSPGSAGGRLSSSCTGPAPRSSSASAPTPTSTRSPASSPPPPPCPTPTRTWRPCLRE